MKQILFLFTITLFCTFSPNIRLSAFTAKSTTLLTLKPMPLDSLEDDEVAVDTLEQIKKITNLSKVAVGLTLGGFITFGLSTIPATIIGVIALIKSIRWRELYEDKKEGDLYYKELKNMYKWVIGLTIATIAAPLFLSIILFAIFGTFVPLSGFFAGMTYLFFEGFIFRTKRSVED